MIPNRHRSHSLTGRLAATWALGGVVAGQFLQIENRINTLKDLRLELELPIIGG